MDETITKMVQVISDQELTDEQKSDMAECVAVAEAFQEWFKQHDWRAPQKVAALGMALVGVIMEVPDEQRQVAARCHLASFIGSLGAAGIDLSGGTEGAGETCPVGATRH